MANTILIIDDDLELLAYLSDCLQHEEYQVFTADNGAEGVKIAIEENPDLILLDIQMPQMNGYEVLEKIKSENIHTRVIMCTVVNKTNDVVLLIKAGASDYITKPFQVEELIAQVRRTLKSEKPIAGYIGEEREIFNLISRGENEECEFKSTLRWNLSAKKNDPAIEHDVLKAVCAFMNTKGGTLLIGISDTGSFSGIDADKFTNTDKFMQHFQNIIRSAISADVITFIKCRFHRFGEKVIFSARCEPSPSPVYVGQNNIEAFYIRTGASSSALSIKETVKYVKEHYGFGTRLRNRFKNLIQRIGVR